MSHRTFFGVALVLAATAPVRSADWPQWRGPNRDGISTETGLLQDWSATKPKLLWKAEGLGAGFSSVAVSKGRIVSMGDIDGASHVVCLDDAGKVQWKSKVGKAGDPGNYPGTRSTPTVDGDLVFAIGQYGDMVCVSIEGKEVWRTSLSRTLGGKQMSGWGYAESPLVDGDKLLASPGGRDGTVAAFDKKTGNLLWRSKGFTDSAGYSSIIVAEIGGTRQYIQLTGASVAGLATDDGRTLWKASRPGKTAVIPDPVYHDNMVFVTSGYGVGCNMFKISGGGDKFSASQEYANTDMKNHHGGVVRVGDHVYGTNDPGILTCMELKTGKVVWQNRSVGKGPITCADGKLYLRSEGSGTVALVAADPSGYKELGKIEQPERTRHKAWAHPVVANGRLYLRDQNNLFCFDISGK